MYKVKDLISEQVLEKVGPNTLISDAYDKMMEKGIRSLLVFQQDQFLGIITMTDIARTCHKKSHLVKDIMSPEKNVTYVSYEDRLEKCRKLLNNRIFHHLVVKNMSGEVKGVISTVDLMLAKNRTIEKAAEIAELLPPT